MRASYYKTRICRGWEAGRCPRSAERCSYAHGVDDLLPSVLPPPSSSSGPPSASKKTTTLADYFPHAEMPEALHLPESLLDTDDDDESRDDGRSVSVPSVATPTTTLVDKFAGMTFAPMTFVQTPTVEKPRMTVDVRGLAPGLVAEYCRIAYLAAIEASWTGTGMCATILTECPAAVVTALHVLGVRQPVCDAFGVFFES